MAPGSIVLPSREAKRMALRAPGPFVTYKIPGTVAPRSRLNFSRTPERPA